MNNFIQHGQTLDFKNTGEDIASGEVVVVGTLVGVAQVDIPAGSTETLAMTGVYEVPKEAAASGKEIAQGQALYIEPTSGKVTTDATDGESSPSAYVRAGVAWADAPSAATKALIKINV